MTCRCRGGQPCPAWYTEMFSWPSGCYSLADDLHIHMAHFQSQDLHIHMAHFQSQDLHIHIAEFQSQDLHIVLAEFQSLDHLFSFEFDSTRQSQTKLQLVMSAICYSLLTGPYCWLPSLEPVQQTMPVIHLYGSHDWQTANLSVGTWISFVGSYRHSLISWEEQA